MCCKSTHCGNSGLLQLLQHAQRWQTHIKLVKIVCSDSQSRVKLGGAQCSLAKQSVNTVGAAGKSCCISLSNMKENTTKAEVIWAAKIAKCNFSFRSNDGIGDTFWSMFTNPETLKTFSMSRSKLSYLMAYGLGPVFKEQLFYDVRCSGSPFSLQNESQVNKHPLLVACA